jgi:hypothetical protein
MTKRSWSTAFVSSLKFYATTILDKSMDKVKFDTKNIKVVKVLHLYTPYDSSNNGEVLPPVFAKGPLSSRTRKRKAVMTGDITDRILHPRVTCSMGKRSGNEVSKLTLLRENKKYKVTKKGATWNKASSLFFTESYVNMMLERVPKKFNAHKCQDNSQ